MRAKAQHPAEVDVEQGEGLQAASSRASSAWAPRTKAWSATETPCWTSGRVAVPLLPRSVHPLLSGVRANARGLATHPGDQPAGLGRRHLLHEHQRPERCLHEGGFEREDAQLRPHERGGRDPAVQRYRAGLLPCQPRRARGGWRRTAPSTAASIRPWRTRRSLSIAWSSDGGSVSARDIPGSPRMCLSLRCETLPVSLTEDRG